MPDMKRIAIVGTTGSGKSTLARQIAQKLALPCVELDAINWQRPAWEPLTEEELRTQVTEAIAQDQWVVEGGYSAVRPLIWARADTVIWLDYPFPVIFSRLLRRTVRRVITRERLWGGNRETLARTLSRDFHFTLVPEDVSASAKAVSSIAGAGGVSASARSAFPVASANGGMAKDFDGGCRHPGTESQSMKEEAIPNSDRQNYASDYVKVTAFVTRGHLEDKQLLVFRHPTAGVQLPAGSAEPGEDVQDAVVREVAEETGLTDIALTTLLGVRTHVLPDQGRVVVRDTLLCNTPGEDDLSAGFPLQRGHTVHEIGRTEKYAQVELREYIVRDGVLQIDSVMASGWVNIYDLSFAVKRHFFHLRVTATTPDTWTWFAEGAHAFECSWIPLSDKPGLVSGQDTWLDWFLERLREE